MRAAETEPFDRLAADIARHQIANVAQVSRLAKARGVAPEALHEAAQIPAVPTDVFRFARVAAHPAHEDVATFRTSGTTSGARGAHSFRTLLTYNVAAMAWGARYLIDPRGETPHARSDFESDRAGDAWTAQPAQRDDLTVISLTPPPEEATDSSLVHMIALFARSQRGPTSYHLNAGSLDPEGVARACDEARRTGRATLLFGTSFAFVHLLDDAGALDLRLPAGSRAMLTGGFKGRSREVPAEELRASIARAFAIEDRAVVGEYGMTELSSQLYEATLVEPGARHGVFVAPPWVRVIAVDPATLAPVPEGEIGIARIVDLANVDSAIAVQTADRVIVRGDHVELLGRLPGATPRGCSLAVEEILG